MKKNPLVFTAPTPIHRVELDIYTPTIFLAGSIDNGSAVDWQEYVINTYKDAGVTFFNPRRKHWQPDAPDSEVRAQINWEMDALQEADAIIVHFASGSLSPISLLELGLYAAAKKVIVVCPKNFWRYANVDVVCERYDIPLFEKLDDGIKAVIYLANQRIGA